MKTLVCTMMAVAMVMATMVGGASPAQAADACALDGLYAGSAFASYQSVGVQLEFWLAFTPDEGCVEGDVAFAYRENGSLSVTQQRYWVGDNEVLIGTVVDGGLFRGQIALVTGGIAQGIALAAYPTLGWQIAGTVLRQGPIE